MTKRQTAAHRLFALPTYFSLLHSKDKHRAEPSLPADPRTIISSHQAVTCVSGAGKDRHSTLAEILLPKFKKGPLYLQRKEAHHL
jgi:hypothetical protein